MPEQKMCGLLSGFGDVEWYGCRHPEGHLGAHKNRNGHEWPAKPSLRPEQDVSDRLSTWYCSHYSWKNTTCVREYPGNIEALCRNCLRNELSDYRQIARSHDAALEQADQQIRALRAENERLRADITDLHREVVCDLMTTFNDDERKGLARAGRRIEALMVEAPST